MSTHHLVVLILLATTSAVHAQSVAPQAEEPPTEAAEPVAEKEEAVGWQSRCSVDEDAWSGSSVPETPVYGRAPDGACFCSVLGARATRASRRHTFGGWALGTLAAGLIVTGAVLGNAESGNLWERERGTLLAISGLAVAPLSYYFFRRAERDGSVAARATEAQGQGSSEDDLAQYRVCTAAKADWVASREASAAFSVIAVERLQRAADESKRQAEAASAHAEESRANAEAANKAAEQAQQSAEQAEGGEAAEPAEEEPEAAPKQPVKRARP